MCCGGKGSAAGHGRDTARGTTGGRRGGGWLLVHPAAVRVFGKASSGTNAVNRTRRTLHTMVLFSFIFFWYFFLVLWTLFPAFSGSHRDWRVPPQKRHRLTVACSMLYGILPLGSRRTVRRCDTRPGRLPPRDVATNLFRMSAAGLVAPTHAVPDLTHRVRGKKARQERPRAVTRHSSG
ncbi:hypothetical protein LY76DRAFT_173556 [Colletotrichum caudatum]|nr:hypothetical protein LY76DRAFT_173556 [Colletotrichum caudatum]